MLTFGRNIIPNRRDLSHSCNRHISRRRLILTLTLAAANPVPISGQAIGSVQLRLGAASEVVIKQLQTQFEISDPALDGFPLAGPDIQLVSHVYEKNRTEAIGAVAFGRGVLTGVYRTWTGGKDELLAVIRALRQLRTTEVGSAATPECNVFSDQSPDPRIQREFAGIICNRNHLVIFQITLSEEENRRSPSIIEVWVNR